MFLMSDFCELTVSFFRHTALIISSFPRGIIFLLLLSLIFVEPWTSYMVSVMLLHLSSAASASFHPPNDILLSIWNNIESIPV